MTNDPRTRRAGRGHRGRMVPSAAEGVPPSPSSRPAAGPAEAWSCTRREPSSSGGRGAARARRAAAVLLDDIDEPPGSPGPRLRRGSRYLAPATAELRDASPRGGRRAGLQEIEERPRRGLVRAGVARPLARRIAVLAPVAGIVRQLGRSAPAAVGRSRRRELLGVARRRAQRPRPAWHRRRRRASSAVGAASRRARAAAFISSRVKPRGFIRRMVRSRSTSPVGVEPEPARRAGRRGDQAGLLPVPQGPHGQPGQLGHLPDLAVRGCGPPRPAVRLGPRHVSHRRRAGRRACRARPGWAR